MDRERFNKELFRHAVDIRVRNYEVDWQGIVHNAVYLLYFEVGRVEYLKQVGAVLDLNNVRGHSKVVLVRNEIDYLSSLTFDEQLLVRTRISTIRNSSFLMEGMILRKDSGQPVSTNIAHHVWLDPATNSPLRVPDTFRKLVQAYEGANCSITWSVDET
jgi:acyl-CoA thioester hydrolase